MDRDGGFSNPARFRLAFRATGPPGRYPGFAASLVAELQCPPRDLVSRVQPGAWQSRTLTGVLGVNVLFGPLLLRVHFGHPFNIGGEVTPALATGAHWVTNITLRYFFF